MRFGLFAAGIATPLAILACTDATTSSSGRPSSSATVSVLAQAAAGQVFGPERFERSTGAPVTVTRTLAPGALSNVDAPFTLHLLNGPPGTSLTTSAIVTIDGVRVVAISDLSQKVATLERVVELTARSEIVVELRGAPGSAIELSIAGVPKPETPPTRVAQISIQKVTVAGNPGTPVDFNNVKGQIDVTLNLDPGDQTVTKVEVMVDGQTACSQILSVAESRQLSLAAVAPEGVEAIDVVCSINTAEFNATTGAAKYPNGIHQLSAKATIGGTTPGNVATPSQALTFNNANTFALTQTLTGTTAQATSAAGLLYRRGSLNVSVLPVVYGAGQAISVATVSFGNALCDASSNATRSLSLSAPAAGSGAWTASFGVTTSSTIAIGTTVKDYEFNGSTACLALPTTSASGEVATVTATDNGGNTIFAGALPANAATAGIRLDNRAPGVPTFWANPNFRQLGWINGTVGLTGAVNPASPTATSSNNWLVDGTADAGVGGYVRILRIGAAAGGLVDEAIGALGSSTPTLPAPSVSQSTYCAVISARDLLGNESALPAAGSACTEAPLLSSSAQATQAMRFGVDIAAPIILYDVSSLPDQARRNGASIGGEIIVTVIDTGFVGNSGMLAGSPVKANVIRREADGTSFTTAPSDCVVGTLTSSNTVCSQTALGPAALPLVSTGITGLSVAGYYTYGATAFDAAGNSTAVSASRVIVYDDTPAVATIPSVPATIAGAFSSASFMNDNLSIRDYFYTVGFGAAPAYLAPATIRVAAAPTIVDAFNAATLSNTNVGVNTTINTFLGLQSTTGAGAPNAYAAGSIPLNALNLFVRDQAQAAYSGPATAPVAPTAPTGGVSITGFTSFIPASTQPVLCAGTLIGGCAGATFTSVTAVATGVTATFNNPFSRVDFYASNGTDLVLIGSVPAASATLVDNGAERVWTWTLSLTGASLYTQLGGVSPAVVGTNVFAFGVSPGGNVALVSQPIAHTINP